MFGSSRHVLYLKYILVLTAIFTGAFLAVDDTSRFYLIDGALMGLQLMIKSFPMLFTFAIALLMGILVFRK